MAINIIDELKEHKKILLPAVGVLVTVLVMITLLGSNLAFLNTVPLDEITSSKKTYSSAPPLSLEKNKDYSAVIETNYGDITLDLFEGWTPITVNNFVFLANEDFYDNLTFHRVVANFVIQGGDPKGDGSGGPGYEFADEIDAAALGLADMTVAQTSYLRSFYPAEVLSQYSQSSVKSFYEKYLGYKYTLGKGIHGFEPFVIAMANSGPATNGSQFFITSRDFEARYLDGKHTVFGEVIDGFDVVDKIENIPVDANSEPTSPVTIEDIRIIIN